ncbi:hypothetical protein LTR36_000656 [Oleoguttula mirabilis]|uniref:Uncharacterized protein n=1 Tax=Oleoguttula mirabilis TaxID=1507867 RepID=A0AAV9JQG9_9PEZI|nr:hypothetical protein LTR36_000656 [Oleoguttula mirabilis]
MFQRAHQMPLAIHNTTFGRWCTRTSGGRIQAESAPVVGPIIDAFTDVPRAFSESSVPARSQLPTEGAMRDLRRARADALVPRSPYLQTSVARNTLAYLDRPLPLTPVSVTSVRELPGAPRRGATVRSNSVRLRQFDPPTESDMLAYGNPPLPPTPTSVSTVRELEEATAITIATARPDMIFLNKPLPPMPASSGSDSSRLSEDTLSPANANFGSRLDLYSQPNVPIKVETGIETGIEAKAEAEGPAWLRRMRRRASYMLKWLDQYRED